MVSNMTVVFARTAPGVCAAERPQLRERRIVPENAFIVVASKPLCFSNKKPFQVNQTNSRDAEMHRAESLAAINVVLPVRSTQTPIAWNACNYYVRDGQYLSQQ